MSTQKPNSEIDQLIRQYDLIPHPEGGFFRETYRSDLVLADLNAPFHGSRSASTAIFYLLTAGTYSAFHKIKSDEVWHFYAGGPLCIVSLDPQTGKVRETWLGQSITTDQKNSAPLHYQYVVPAGHWFGAIPGPDTSYAFVGCTVAPGFDFADFMLADPAEFLKTYPEAEPWKHMLPKET